MSSNGHSASNGRNAPTEQPSELRPSPLLPDGYLVPASRWVHPSTRLRHLLSSEPYVFAPGVYDPYTAQLAMYSGFPAVYFSGYSFAWSRSHGAGHVHSLTSAAASVTPRSMPMSVCATATG